MKRTITGLAVAATTLAAAPAAMAQPAVGLIGGGGNDALAMFDTSAPGTITSTRAVTGLLAGERLQGIDYRWIPSSAATGATPGLYGLGLDTATGGAHLYTIDLATAVATPVGAGFNRPSGAAFGFDFNPAVDRVRVVDGADDNYRAHPDTGAFVAADTVLSPGGQGVSAVAYDRVNVAPAIAPATTPTTLFAINPTTDQLVTQGGVNSVPSPNGGVLNAVGPLGVDAAAGAPANFDIAFDGTAYATLQVGGVQGLYTLNLATGAATAVGATAQTFTGLAIVPGSAQFTTTAFANSERSAATITVSRTGSTATAATVNYATGGGTADGNDYKATSGTLTFAPGESTKSFAVELTDDSVREDEETVGLTLSGPSSGLMLGAAAATLTIIDNDGPPVVAPPAADVTAPTLALSTVRSSYSLRAFKKGITVRMTTNEPARLEAALYARVTRATAARFLAGSYNLELTGKKLGTGAGTRTLKLKPKSKLIGTPRKSFKVKLRVLATDPAGNDRTVTKIITIKK